MPGRNHCTSHQHRADRVDEAINCLDTAIGSLHDMVCNLEETQQPSGLVDAWHDVIKRLSDIRNTTANLAR